jgi:holin-like protein
VSLAVGGLLALLALLFLRRRVDPPIDLTSRWLLRWFPLFFVPAGVGVIRYLALIRVYWLGLAVALVLSVALAILVTALVGGAVARAQERT